MFRTAFTLIELLVVITIIVILLSLLTPALDRAVKMAERTLCGTNQKQFSTANHMYAMDSRRVFVPIKSASRPEANDQAATYDPWFRNAYFAAIMGYTSTYTAELSLNGIPEPIWPQSIVCPTTPPNRLENPQTAIRSSLAFNWSNLNAGNFGDPALAINQRQINNPGSKVQMVDATDWHTFGRRWKRADYTAYWDVFRDDRTGNGAAAYRHDEGANVTYFDGSVVYRHKTETWRFTDEATLMRDQIYNSNLWDIAHAPQYVNN